MGIETAKSDTGNSSSKCDSTENILKGINKSVKSGGESAVAIVGGIGKLPTSAINPFICRHQTVRCSTSSSSSCVSSESGKYSGSDSKNAVSTVSSKINHYEKKQQKKEKKVNIEESDNDSDSNDSRPKRRVILNTNKLPQSVNPKSTVTIPVGKGGIINTLIDKELIRTAIMEQDEDSLPRGIQQGYFKNLTHLDISGNSAEKLDLRSLSRLEWLCCANNNLEVLSLSGCSLTYLDCSNNNLHSISVEPVPNNLATLQISYNVMDDLPTWTWMVPELFIVYASHNRVRQLDCKFQNCLSNLPIRELYLHCNKIEFVSKDFIQRATKLKVLNLSQNYIEYMPNFGKKCPLLELSLSSNRLQDTDDKDALDFLLECSHLKRLFLGYNKIENLSERCLSAWKNMEELILCGNRIRSLPSKVSSMSNLRILRVHSNRLESVPSLNKMTVLKMVDLSHNNLKKINIENLISGNLTYLDISCMERLTVNPEKLHCQKRPMNLVEVSNPRKKIPLGMKNNEHREFPANPPWEIGFSELPDRNLTLSVTQYRDINLAFGKEALFGIFDGGEGNPAPKYIPKCIAKIYAEEKNIEENSSFSLKYTLLNAMKNVRQLGNNKPIQGLLCLLSMHEDPLVPGAPTFQLDLAMIGGIRCLLVESGRKVTRITDMAEDGPERSTLRSRRSHSSSPTCSSDDSAPSSLDSQSETGSTRSASALSVTGATKNNLNGNIPDPKLFTIPLTTKAEYLVIANQSLWNHMNEDEIISEIECNKNKKSVLVAKKLTDMAQSHSCRKCLSVIIVRFKWHFTSANNHGGAETVLGRHKVVSHQVSELGPLSYCSGSSDYSDMSNPLVSVTTPDSAIDSDRSSRTSSSTGASDSVNGSSTAAIKRVSKSSSSNNRRTTEKSSSKSHSDSRRMTSNGSSPSTTTLATTVLKNERNQQRKNSLEDDDEDAASLANTSISQMSVEQFKCWEYMLEQNTKLLFKKELDSLSKGVFQRNQKLRKSVHFPYQQQDESALATQTGTGKKNKSAQNLFQYPGAQVNKSSSPGFYTLSKAKSLSHLFSASGGDSQGNKGVSETFHHQGYPPPQTQQPHPFIFPSAHHSFGNMGKFPPGIHNGNGGGNSSAASSTSNNHHTPGFLGSVRSNTKMGLIGGPNAAYFGTIQRIVPPSAMSQHHYPTYYGPAEIQEIKNLDSIEHDSRLKKYWENKITEL